MIKPKSEASVADVASQVFEGMKLLHKQGHDGRDIVFGVLSAARMFVSINLYPPSVAEELSALAEWFKEEK